MKNRTSKNITACVKIGSKDLPHSEYEALIPTKVEVETVVLKSKKIKSLIINEQDKIAALAQKSERTLARHINLLKQQMEMAFLQRNIEGYVQSQIMYWQVFTALTFPTQKQTVYCNEIREMIQHNTN